jgi:hypothetical protein
MTNLNWKERRDNLGDVDIDVRIILKGFKVIEYGYEVMNWIDWLRTGTSLESCEQDNVPWVQVWKFLTG